MSNPYVGEIRMFGGNFAPAGWALCNGQLLDIAEYETLFNLIGTTYGGDGFNTFAVPDLQGRMPVHQGRGDVLGGAGGVETVTLTSAQLAAHTHQVLASSADGTTGSPAGAVWAHVPGGATRYTTDTSDVAAAGTGLVGAAGSSQPHENMSPYLAVNFIISLFGIYPSQT